MAFFHSSWGGRTRQAHQTHLLLVSQLRELPDPCPAPRRQAELGSDGLDRRPMTRRTPPESGEPFIGLSWVYPVGRPGLDPGTLGLKGGPRSSRAFGCFHRPCSSRLPSPASPLACSRIQTKQ